jgi:hypothetical protein
MNKTRSHLYMFWRILKLKTIWIKFLIFSHQNILPWFYFIFLFHFSLSVFLLLSSWHITYSQPYFFHYSPPSASLITTQLFVVSSAFGTMEPPHLLPLFPSKNSCTPLPPPSPFPYLVTGVIKVPPPLVPSSWPSAFCRPTTLLKELREHLHYPSHPSLFQSLLHTPGTISPS